jgi:hypothetical protein
VETLFDGEPGREAGQRNRKQHTAGMSLDQQLTISTRSSSALSRPARCICRGRDHKRTQVWNEAAGQRRRPAAAAVGPSDVNADCSLAP